MNQKPASTTDGFTLIELLLAMSFVAALLLAVAVTVIQMSSVYTHGIMLTSINKAARTISNSLTSDIQNSPPINLSKQFFNSPGNGGRLCLNGYTYVWNFNNSNKNQYVVATAPVISLAKIADPGASNCSSGNPYGTIPYGPNSVKNNVELLDDGSHDLILQSLSLSNPVNDPTTQESLYLIHFVVSTNSNNDVLAPGTPNNPNSYYICAPPSLAAGDFNRCAVQEFTIAVRAGNGG